jgi:flagellar hook-length control protein FliK
LNINALTELGAAPNSKPGRQQVFAKSDPSFMNNLNKAVDRATQKESRLSGSKTKNADVSKAEGTPPEGNSASTNDAQGKTENHPKDKNDLDPADVAAMAAMMMAPQPQQAVAQMQDASEQSVQLLAGPLLEKAAEPDNGLIQAAIAGLGLMDEAEPTQAPPKEAAFVEQALDEIRLTVVSNDAERTVSAAQSMPEQDTTAADEQRENDPNKFGFIKSAGFQAPIAQDRPAVIELLPETEIAEPHAIRQPLLNGIVEQVETAVSRQQSELYVQLKPEVLGGLSIRLTLTEEGLNAQVRTSSQHLQSLINADVLQLEAALRDKGIQVVQMDVVYDQMANNQNLDQQRQQFTGGQPQNGGRHIMSIAELPDGRFEQAYEGILPVDAGETQGVEYSA